MTVVTRFAPSPTGFLHIGGARTALFNWLYARHFGGRFLLRVEDTDRKRSTQEAIDAILAGMKWLDLKWDGEVVFQHAQADRHKEVALSLLEKGHAYWCYCSPEELTRMRNEARAAGLSPRYNGFWRDRDPAEAPEDVAPVLRFKAPKEGMTTLQDLVQGEITLDHQQLDDLILLRADGTPTYMLSVIVDDHDMGVTHIIRGDDHLTNAFRQIQIYQAMEWQVPDMAHIPLIHGQDGAKLSKRHGALGVETYKDLGFLPEALCNYLTRLGWSHGDEEIFTREQAIDWFDLDHAGRSPSRFDMAKLTNLNAHYIRETSNTRLLDLISPLIEEKLKTRLEADLKSRLLRGMDGLKQRAKTILELADSALFYCYLLPLPFEEKALKVLTNDACALLQDLLPLMAEVEWEEGVLEASLRQHAEEKGLKFGKIAQPLRAALSGKAVSPGIFEVMQVLGREETIARLESVIDL